MHKKISDSETLTALSDIKHRSWVLKKSVWDYMKLLSAQSQMQIGPDGYDLDQQRLNSEADRALEEVLLNSKQWYKAVAQDTIPLELKDNIAANIDPDLQKTVECLRNLREHWEDNRRYFEDNAIAVPKGKKDVRWFKQKYPNANPWSSGLSVGIGYYIAGPEVLNLHNILVQADKIDEVLGMEKA